MSAESALDGIRKFYRRTCTLAELQAKAMQCITIAEDEVVITSAGIEGASGGGVGRGYTKGEILNVLEDLIREMMAAGVTYWTDTQTSTEVRSLLVHSDRSFHVAQL